MQITAVRTLTTVLPAPQVSALKSGTNCVLSWVPPTPTGQSVIAGYRVFRGTTLANMQLLAVLNDPTQLSITDPLLGTQLYQVQAFDQFEKGLLSSVVSQSVGNLLFPGGHWMTVGGDDKFNGFTDWSTHVTQIANQDPLGAIVGFIAVFQPNQIEGAFGDFSAWNATIQQLLNFLATLPGPMRQLGVFANITGNVGTSSVPPYMLNNPTYGKVQSGTGYQGGLFSGSAPGLTTTGHCMRFDVPATAARIAAWSTNLWTTFGSAVPLVCMAYSEYQNFTTIVPEMSSAAITATFAGSGGMFDQIRAGSRACQLHSPSFMNQSDFPALLSGSDRAFMVPMVFDFTNEVAVRTGGNRKLITTNAAWKGGSYSSLPNGSFVPNYPGLFDRRQLVLGGGRALAAHIGADELGNTRFPSNAVPPALVGDGALNTAIFPFAQQMQVSIMVWYPDGYAGPPCNTTGPYTGQPPNYADYSGWGNLIGFIKANPVPVAAVPAFYG